MELELVVKVILEEIVHLVDMVVLLVVEEHLQQDLLEILVLEDYLDQVEMGQYPLLMDPHYIMLEAVVVGSGIVQTLPQEEMVVVEQVEVQQHRQLLELLTVAVVVEVLTEMDLGQELEQQVVLELLLLLMRADKYSKNCR